MKGAAALVAFLSAISAVSAQLAPSPMAPLPSEYDRISSVEMGSSEEWPDVMYFPDDNGEPVAVRIGGSDGLIDRIPDQEPDIFFKLFTRNGPTNGEIVTPGVVNSLKESTFNASENTLFITHGFIQSIDSDTINTMKNMYVAYQRGNVFAVDWSKVAKRPPYSIAKLQTVQVGRMVAAFIAFLVNSTGVDVADVHLAGHSLGAHVMGIAGKTLSIIIGKKVARITGLDPAGPLYRVADKDSRLDRGDGDFVDVIHTCGGLLGMSAPIGHADFYPNGGKLPQPGCSWDLVKAGTCSHSRSWQFFAESFNSQLFSSRACATHKDYLRNNCNNSPLVPMGLYTANRYRARN